MRFSQHNEVFDKKKERDGDVLEGEETFYRKFEDQNSYMLARFVRDSEKYLHEIEKPRESTSDLEKKFFLFRDYRRLCSGLKMVTLR